jgi:hypothetical protein
MKRLKSRLAIILTLMMIFTSFEFVGVFAAEEALGNVSVAAYSSSDRVVFIWNAVEGADGYIIDGSTKVPASQLRYDKIVGEGGYAAISVQAYKDPEEVTADDPDAGQAAAAEPVYSNVATAAGNAVQTIRYRVRIKKGGTLKAHGGNGPGSIRVTKGQYIDCYGFGGGKYIFNYGGSIFYCNKSRTNKRSCIYNSGRTYSAQEAEFFVNDRGLSSSTGTLVWINTYTQTLYMFNGSAGSWHCVLASKCSTGKAASPTPTGVSGHKTIWKKIKKRHGIKYWSPFSQINSVHSKKAKWRMGAPKSNGCVRNYIDAAYAVYVGAPIGTKVLVY